MPTSGDVVDLGQPEGREAGFRHPAILVTARRVLSAQPTVVHVVPLTTTIRGHESEVVIVADGDNGLDHTSAAQCQHVRSVSTNRIVRVRGNVGPVDLHRVRDTLATILDIAT